MAPNGSDSSNISKGRISAKKHWCFTLNNYTEEEITVLLNKFEEGSKRYCFQEETGEEKGTPHLQGYVEFKVKQRPIEYIGLKRVIWSGTRKIGKSITYCTKDRTRTGKQWVKGITVKRPVRVIQELFDWQENLRLGIEKFLETDDPAEDRIVHWIWEKEGRRGKSAFAKYLCVKYDALALSGKAGDMKNGIVNYVKKHGDFPRLLIIDIPRSDRKHFSYAGLEEVKNGCFFSPKYEGEMVIGNCPYIICFANSPPDKSTMSEDRWDIIHI